MTIWNLHFLNARHRLTPVMSELRAAARAAVAAAQDHAEIPDFDLVVAAGERVITGWGASGYSPAPAEIRLTVDPPRFDPQAITRLLVHELHHLIRWDGPGYGRSLGEALVSEGLAGHFVLQVLGGKPDPWDAMTPADGLARRASKEWSRLGYDHAEWFIGSGKTIRRWTGYGLGHRLVGNYLAANPGQTAVTLAAAPADRFRGIIRQMGKDDILADQTVPGDPPEPQG